MPPPTVAPAAAVHKTRTAGSGGMAGELAPLGGPAHISVCVRECVEIVHARDGE